MIATPVTRSRAALRWIGKRLGWLLLLLLFMSITWGLMSLIHEELIHKDERSTSSLP